MTTRFNIVSEVALEAGQPRPIHMFRPGTFTDMGGRETSFSAEDVQGIVARFSKRRKLPITERHDFGQAIGRLQEVWADASGNLFGLPKWNAKGRALLEDEIYDGFSCELDKDEHGWSLIGGSLTNYPAVGNLEPVTLQAPPIENNNTVSLQSEPEAATAPLEETQWVQDAPAAPATSTPLADVQVARRILASGPVSEEFREIAQQRIDALFPPVPLAEVPPRADRANNTIQETPIMSDPQVAFEAPALPPINDPLLQSRLDAILAQREASLAQQQRAFEERVQAEFERRLLETEQRNAIRAFAHSRTMTTPEQPYAIPGTAAELEQLLLETPAQVRGKWQLLLTRICLSGAVSFDEIGSSGEGSADADRWSILVNAKVAAGLSRSEAILAVGREHPDLYAAQSAPKKRGR